MTFQKYYSLLSLLTGIVFIPILISCTPKPVCMSPLSQIISWDIATQQCDLPENITETWNCSVNPNGDTIEDRNLLYETCGLQEIGTKNQFLFAENNVFESLRLFYFISSLEEQTDPKILLKMIGKPKYPVDYTYLQQNKSKQPLKNSKLEQFEENISKEGHWGKFPLWHIDNLKLSKDPQIVFSSKITVKTLRHILASIHQQSEKISIVYQNLDLYKVDLYVPTSDDIPRYKLDENKNFSYDKSAKRIRLSLPNDMKIEDVLSVLTQIDAEVELEISNKPCLNPPEGMICVEGNDETDTFYIDKEPTKECDDSRVCTHSEGTWRRANEVCILQGKRLPTVYETSIHKLEKLSWTSTWHGEHEPPLGPCSDRYPCKKYSKKSLSDGTGKRFREKLKNPVYCASSYPYLATNKPYMIGYPLSPPTLEPKPELAKIASQKIIHDDLDDKGICDEEVREQWSEKLKNGGRSTTECRDPNSYVTSNEPKRYLWAPYIKNLGEGYAGVGSDQNYDFISVAKSEWAWLYDYDPNVYRLHKMLKPLILHAETTKQFVALFESDQKSQSKELIQNFYTDTLEQKDLYKLYSKLRRKLHSHYKSISKKKKYAPNFGWLANPDNYAYIRKMHQQNRIIPVAGDMLGDNGLYSIGEAAKAMGIKMKIFYTSNAPTAWGGTITPKYMRSVLNFPFDDSSIVLSTYNSGGFDQDGYWHHSVASGLLMQQRISSGDYINQVLVWDRIPTDHTDVTLCRVPSKIAGR